MEKPGPHPKEGSCQNWTPTTDVIVTAEMKGPWKGPLSIPVDIVQKLLRSQAESIAATAEAMDFHGVELANWVREQYPMDRICDGIEKNMERRQIP
jgi:hypothetical protein